MTIQKFRRLCGFFAAAIVCAAHQPAYAEKTGVLFLHVGETEHFRFDSWQFTKLIFDVLPPGFFAGSSLEGGDCYTIIHYADQVEADMCGVAEGTPIDSLCNEYAGAYPVQPIAARGVSGDRTFGADCNQGLFPYVLLLEDSTIDPLTGTAIVGPHITDPAGTGLGIPEFIEIYNFGLMRLYHRLPERFLPQRDQLLRWWYGNDHSGQPAAHAGIQGLLNERRPEMQFVFRHGWEQYMRNSDVYGNPHVFTDSTESVLQELIIDEGVSRIVVLHSYPSFSNLTQYGHEWYDESGRGVSAVDGATFTECVENLRDGAGPKTVAQLERYRAHKPWEKHVDHPFPLVARLARELDPAVALSFAPAYGGFAAFGDAVLAKLQHTVARYGIPHDAALKVILIHHGFAGGYAGAQECDCYNRNVDQLFTGVRARIQDAFSWMGAFELAHAAGEFAEGMDDPASVRRPFGRSLSFGEHVDMGINGTYVNALGRKVNNGNDMFDYIIAIPYFFDAESVDSLFEKRGSLGNYIPDASGSYVRDTCNADGSDFCAEDFDDEYSSVHVYDATGWPSRARWSRKTIYKGSAERPTTLILTGAMLSTADGGMVRDKMTEAVVSAIEAALDMQGAAAVE